MIYSCTCGCKCKCDNVHSCMDTCTCMCSSAHSCGCVADGGDAMAAFLVLLLLMKLMYLSVLNADVGPKSIMFSVR